jgi:hypothetical protein
MSYGKTQGQGFPALEKFVERDFEPSLEFEASFEAFVVAVGFVS